MRSSDVEYVTMKVGAVLFMFLGEVKNKSNRAECDCWGFTTS